MQRSAGVRAGCLGGVPPPFGETPAQALAEVERAMAAWLDAARATGRAVPEPRYRPALYAV